VITVSKFFEGIHAIWNVIPLRSHSVSRHWRIGALLGVNAAVTVFLIFGVGIFAINLFFVFSVSLLPCVIFTARPRRSAFRCPGRCVFEKVQLSGQLTVFMSPGFLVLYILMRSPLLESSASRWVI
jgi:hypothetical protein